jgi:hypothetical protein
MRDMLHVCGLFSLFAVLAMSFPSTVPVPTAVRGAAFAEFVQLSSARHDAVLEAARTSWQVRSEARSRPSVGRLDADAPLLADSLPPPAAPVYRDPAATGAPLPRPDATIYSFMPATMGTAFSDYAPGTGRAAAPSAEEPAFRREEMLSTENSPILKELMQ